MFPFKTKWFLMFLLFFFYKFSLIFFSAAPKVLFGIYYKIFSCLFSYFLIIKIGCCVFFLFDLFLDAKRKIKNWTTLFVMKIVLFESNNYQFCAVFLFWDFICVCGICNFVLKFFFVISKDSFILLQLHLMEWLFTTKKFVQLFKCSTNQL